MIRTCRSIETEVTVDLEQLRRPLTYTWPR